MKKTTTRTRKKTPKTPDPAPEAAFLRRRLRDLGRELEFWNRVQAVISRAQAH